MKWFINFLSLLLAVQATSSSPKNRNFLRPTRVKNAPASKQLTSKSDLDRLNMNNDRTKIRKGESLSKEELGTTTSLSSSESTTINLVKTIVGAGVLTLPCGMARLSENGVLPIEIIIISTVLLVVFGGLSAFGFSLIGSVCAKTGARTYSEAWGKTVSEDTTWLPSLIAVILCFTGSVKCLTTLGDVFRDIIAYGLQSPVDSIPRDPLLLTVVLSLVNF